MKRVVIGFVAWLALTGGARASERFELADGDRVILLGDALIERGQTHGYLETLLTARYPDRPITFRNLGWSGDTVFGDARAGFGTAADGFKHLKEHVLALKPTVILVGYGANESFAGRAGLQRFRDGYNRLRDVLAETKARVVVLSPIRLENLGRPLPDPAAHNRDLALYRDALKELAAQRGDRFVDLFDLLGEGAGPAVVRPLTDDEIHLTAHGYRTAARAIAGALGLDLPRWKVAIDAAGHVETAEGTKLSGVKAGPDGVRFEATDATLPGLPIDQDAPGNVACCGPMPTLRVIGLAPGRYRLTIDGKTISTADAQSWASGVPVTSGPAFDQLERLRQATIKKNLLYFYRWRPQNETYLFGFRKHEQGQNAREIPQFDPLVAEQERIIAGLRGPRPHVYELTRESAPAR